jgi:hypothetical protein
MIPNFFIVGAPRCGTTALFDYLQAHPEIAMASYKEPHYFGTDLRGERFTLYRGRLDQYQALFKHVKNENRVGEGSVGYLFSKNAAAEIHAYNPDARIIIMLRHPIEALYSMYEQARFSGSTEYEDFDLMLRHHETLLHQPELDTVVRLLSVEGVRYGEQVKRYLDIFGREAVHIILYDDFSQNTAEVYRKTLEFLGVDATFTLDTFKVINAGQKSRNPLINQVLKNPFIQRIGRSIPNLSLPIYRLLKVVNSRRIETKTPILPSTREYLSEALMPDITLLESLLEVDLSHWKSPEYHAS